jgi:hypothetical protein
MIFFIVIIFFRILSLFLYLIFEEEMFVAQLLDLLEHIGNIM